MTVVAVTSASVGTKLATASDTKITGLTITQPSATADMNTPLTLVDAAAAPAAPVGFFRTIFSAALPALTFLFGIKPTGPSIAPGLTAPTWPQGIVTGSIPFTAGVFVASCPAGVTFSLTTAP
jgi:hypothetical protein